MLSKDVAGTVLVCGAPRELDLVYDWLHAIFQSDVRPSDRRKLQVMITDALSPDCVDAAFERGDVVVARWPIANVDQAVALAQHARDWCSLFIALQPRIDTACADAFDVVVRVTPTGPIVTHDGIGLLPVFAHALGVAR